MELINFLFRQEQEISNLCGLQQLQRIDVSPLTTALEDLVASSMIIVESPRLSERTLRVKKKKVTYALQIILPEMDAAAEVKPYLLSEEGFKRLRTQRPMDEPIPSDMGTDSLYQVDQPVIKDPDSGQFRCVFK